MDEQLWIVMDGYYQCLWYGRGTQADAIAGAKTSPYYSLRTTLHLYAISAEIIIKGCNED